MLFGKIVCMRVRFPNIHTQNKNFPRAQKYAKISKKVCRKGLCLVLKAIVDVKPLYWPWYWVYTPYY